MAEDKDMNQNEPVNSKDEILNAISEMDVDMERTICRTKRRVKRSNSLSTTPST